MKRRRRKPVPQRGELYQIVQGDTVLAEKLYQNDGPALSLAQNLLVALGLGKTRDETIKFTVRLAPVLGPPDDLYDVLLTPEGAILTAPAGVLT